jgi:hypothetical protein
VLFSNGSTIAQDNANFFWDDTNNRLGIGTSSPTYDLTLSKSVAAGNVVLNIENTSTTGAARLWFGNNASSTGARIQYFGATHAARPNLFSIGTDIANDMMFETSGTERVRITSGGNVGIGTDSPAGKLTILNGTTYTPSAVGAIGGSVSARLQIQGGESGIMLSSDISPTTGSQTGTQAYQLGLQIGFYNVNDIRNQIYFGNAPLTFVYSGNQGTSVSEYMRIWSSTGNVNIGTTPASDSGYKLDVNGTGRFSGDLTLSSGGDRIFSINDTGGNLFQIQAASNILYYSARSTGGSLAFRTNGTNDVKLSIAPTGAATFSSSVTAASLRIDNNSNLIGNGRKIFGNDDAANYYIGDIGGTGGLTINWYGGIIMRTLDTERMRITSGGVLQVANSSGTLGTIIGSERLNVNGDVFAYGTITTGPTGYGAGAFKIGPLQTGTASSAAGCIPIVIDGTLRYINVFNAI